MFFPLIPETLIDLIDYKLYSHSFLYKDISWIFYDLYYKIYNSRRHFSPVTKTNNKINEKNNKQKQYLEDCIKKNIYESYAQKLGKRKDKNSDIISGTSDDRKQLTQEVINRIYGALNNDISLLCCGNSEKYNSVVRMICEINNLCEDIGAELKIFLIPTRRQVDPVDMKLIKDTAILMGIPHIYYDSPQKILTELLTNNGYNVIDLLKPLQQFSQLNRPVFYQIDGHWNEYGIAVAVHMIGDLLLSEGEKNTNSLNTPQ
jgi:hypothetical protein